MLVCGGRMSEPKPAYAVIPQPGGTFDVEITTSGASRAVVVGGFETEDQAAAWVSQEQERTHGLRERAARIIGSEGPED